MQELIGQLAQQTSEKYFGKYRGFVADNQDPEHRARIRLRIPSVLGEQLTSWALPCVPFGGMADQGLFAVPEVDAQVWVEFEEGNLSSPIWTGTFWQEQQTAPVELSSDVPDRRAFKTPAGHSLTFVDQADEESTTLFHPKGSSVTLDKHGSVDLTDANGASVTLDSNSGELVIKDSNGNQVTMSSAGTTAEDSNGNKIEMAASGISVEGQKIVINGSQVTLAGEGGEPIIKGQSFLSLFMTHVHPTGVGPSGPPVPQGEMSTLSSKVLTS